MKRILITGVDSYIGNKFEEWVSQWPDEYICTKISLRNDDWKKMDWSEFDSILHVAGIAHNSSDPKLEDLYYKVNRDLTIEVAQKAKVEGVRQFIYMSSIIVYGTRVEYIDNQTKPNPDNFYGDSKLQAERKLKRIETDGFRLVTVRPPMVYGKGSKGNYHRLAKLAQLTPIFPKFKNQRSMLYIDNLSELLRIIVLKDKKGIFFPQNKDYVETSNLVKECAKVHGNRILQFSFFNPIINMLLNFHIINKIFGNLVYDKKISDFELNYIVENFEKSISKTELLN